MKISNNVARIISTVLVLDLGFGIGPINLTLKAVHAIKVRRYENELRKTLAEGSIATLYIDSRARKGYVYIKRNGIVTKSYFNEYITKPKWALDEEV